MKTFDEVLLPVALPEVQQKVVTECETVDNEVNDAHAKILAARTATEEEIKQVNATAIKLSQIATINPSKSEIRMVADETMISFVEMASVSEKGVITQSEPRALGSLRKGSYTYFAENDILIAKITPCMENGKCALATGLESGIGMGSTEFHVIRANHEKILTAFLFAFLNREAIRKSAVKVMTGASGHRRVPASFYETLLIPLPTLSEQKKFVAKIEALEKQIADAQAVIDSAAARKQAILQKYL